MNLREINGVEKPVIDYAKARGFFYRKVAWVGRVGAPDRLFSREDTGPFFVEFKRPKKGAETHQSREIERMRNAGITVYLINSYEAGCALFD